MRHLTTLAFAIVCMTAQQTHAEDLDRAREQYLRYWEQQREMEKTERENDSHQKAQEAMAREKRRHYEQVQREDARRRADFYRQRDNARRQ
ncbi:hypothetical protein OC610_02055 [Pseudomonas sp. SAICEU22]|uniref:Uncharacterized protein n=1 Tax=Pseudomonas agronomica TaxID=2979328 RepID=A0ABT3F260_9PSED|nr:hypothetical protein [Pseudomonas agronomica]MCW1243178.1 hypothetical protein [Pseudomonas agronomica]